MRLTLRRLLAIDPLLTLAAVGALSGHVVVVRLVGGADDAASNGGSRNRCANLSDLIHGRISLESAPSRYYGQEDNGAGKPSRRAQNRRLPRFGLSLARPQHPVPAAGRNFSSISCAACCASSAAASRERPAEHRPNSGAADPFVERLSSPTALAGASPLNHLPDRAGEGLDRVESCSSKDAPRGFLPGSSPVAAAVAGAGGIGEASRWASPVRYETAPSARRSGDVSFSLASRRAGAVVGARGIRQDHPLPGLGRMVEVPRNGALFHRWCRRPRTCAHDLRRLVAPGAPGGLPVHRLPADKPLRYGDPDADLEAGWNRWRGKARTGKADIRGFSRDAYQTLVRRTGGSPSCGGQRQRARPRPRPDGGTPRAVLDDALAERGQQHRAAILS